MKNHTGNTAKTKITFLSLSVFSIFTFAQETRLDSINLSELEKEMRIRTPEMAFSVPEYFTDAELFFHSDNLNFKRVQTPEYTSEFGFGAKGIFKFSPRVVLTGKLQVSREDEKNVSYILTDERTTDQNYISNPAYFYVPRKSDWMKQYYNLAGNLAYNPWKGLILTGSARGEFSKSFGNTDPRPEIGNFHYELEGKLGYKLGKHSAFGQIGYFNRRKESDIMYTVSELNAPNFFETYIRYNTGYGNFYYNTGYADFFYKYDGVSYGGEYQYTDGKSFFTAGYTNEYYIDRFVRYYSYQMRDENNALQTYYDHLNYAGLKTDRHTFYARYLGHLGRWRWNSDLTVTDQKDINFDYRNLYTSYRVFNTEANFKNVFSKFNRNGELWRLGFDFRYGNQDIRDVSVVLHKKLSFADYQISAEKEFKTASNQKLGLGISQSLYLPLVKSLEYVPYQSSQTNVFVQNIAFPDYAYDTSSRLGLGMMVKYHYDYKKVRYEFFAGASNVFFLNNDSPELKKIVNPDFNTRFNLGLNFKY